MKKLITLYIVPLVLLSCEPTNYRKIEMNAMTDKIIEKTDHQYCTDQGLDPNMVDYRISSLYWDCRADLAGRRIDKTSAKPEDLKENGQYDSIAQEYVKKSIIAKKRYVEQQNATPIDDDFMCMQRGYMKGSPSNPMTAGYYKCKMALFRERKTNLQPTFDRAEKNLHMVAYGLANKDRDMTMENNIPPAPSITRKDSAECMASGFPRGSAEYAACLDRIYSQKLCNMETVTQMSKMEYENSVDCQNIVELKLPDKLTQTRREMVRFADNDGKMGKGMITVPPHFSKIELLQQRDTMYKQCMQVKMRKAKKEIVNMRQRCSRINNPGN